MRTIVPTLIAVLSMVAAPGSAMAQASPTPGHYTSNTVNSGAGGQQHIKVAVNGTSALTYIVFVDGSEVLRGTVPGNGSQKFTITLSDPLPANVDVRVEGDTSGSGQNHTATITLQP
jgi:hypothetical protein